MTRERTTTETRGTVDGDVLDANKVLAGGKGRRKGELIRLNV